MISECMLEEMSEAVGRALRKTAGRVKSSGHGGWTFTVSNGSVLPASASLDADWLGFEAVLPAKRGDGMDAEGLWRLLVWNGRIGGGARYTAVPGSGRVCVRADVPVCAGVDVSARVKEVCAGLAAAHHRYRSGGKRKRGGVGSKDDGSTAAGERVSELCRSAGWETTDRSSGEVLVELEVPGSFQQARATVGGDGGVVFGVRLLDGSDLCGASRGAVALMLLSASRTLRMVRATAEAGAEGAVGFEVALGPGAGSAEAGHALCALSVACRDCSEEAEALCEASLAEQYWEVCGWSA